MRPALFAAAAGVLALAVGTAASRPQALPQTGPASARPQPTPTPGGRSAREGVYTEEQARRGRRLFQVHCASCHTEREFEHGYPTLYDLFVSRTEMPEPSPGALSPQEYADLLAYLLETWEFPPGREELKGEPEILKQIRLDPAKTPDR